MHVRSHHLLRVGRQTSRLNHSSSLQTRNSLSTSGLTQIGSLATKHCICSLATEQRKMRNATHLPTQDINSARTHLASATDERFSSVSSLTPKVKSGTFISKDQGALHLLGEVTEKQLWVRCFASSSWVRRWRPLGFQPHVRLLSSAPVNSRCASAPYQERFSSELRRPTFELAHFNTPPLLTRSTT